MTRVADIYKKEGRYYVLPQCITEIGIGIACGEYLTTESPNDLYSLLLQAFQQSKNGVKHPEDWKEFNRNFFSIFGVKSSKEFHKNMQLVTATEECGIVTLLPCANLGAKRGFEGLSQLSICIRASEPQSVMVEALNKAISLATIG